MFLENIITSEFPMCSSSGFLQLAVSSMWLASSSTSLEVAISSVVTTSAGSLDRLKDFSRIMFIHLCSENDRIGPADMANCNQDYILQVLMYSGIDAFLHTYTSSIYEEDYTQVHMPYGTTITMIFFRMFLSQIETKTLSTRSSAPR